MRILLSVFSCEPGRGSEPEVGYRTLLGAARRHEVWALVSATGLPALERALSGEPARTRIHLVAVPVGADEGMLPLVAFHLRYARWQRQIARLARDLDRQFDFDLVHHVTLSPVWAPVGVRSVPKPLVWGPVGGTVETPLTLIRELGVRGTAEDAARAVVRRLLARAPWTRATVRAAAVVLAQNEHTARRLQGAVRVLSNGTAVAMPAAPPQGDRTGDVVCVGRLVAWKGPTLALRALRHMRDPATTLRFYGSGPDEPRVRRLAHRWGLSERVRFSGWLPRDELLARVAAAGVVLHPSLHDEAGLAVAEALMVGTPVVCLDHGGPAEVVSHWSSEQWAVVSPGRPEPTARALARAVDAFLDDRPPVADNLPVAPATSFTDALEDAYRAAARMRHHGTYQAARGTTPDA